MLNSWGLAFALYADFHSIFDDAGDAISTDVCARIYLCIYIVDLHIYDICAAHFTPIAKLIEICNRNLLILLRQRAQGIPNHKVHRRTEDYIEEYKLHTFRAHTK